MTLHAHLLEYMDEPYYKNVNLNVTNNKSIIFNKFDFIETYSTFPIDN